ncbi:MAG: zinc ribbon domain-containing protein [Lachnospiraceae bacterium]|nr:zinc ribbon domain-containing protein [Ruminococcus sp.]MCM1274864.1 zinc ribbon domain-containing protein [Lachnospiraceae bacterium]
MICTKCNSEVPNGARFCPVCGSACGAASDVKPVSAPPEPEKKNFCGKCGLELRQGAKFCAVCGAPAAGIGDIKPAENSGATFGSGAMSAVSLEKPSSSDNLVAAMNTASAPSASTFVPTPSNDIGSGYSPAAPAFIPETPIAPAVPAPSFGAPNNNPFGNANDNPFGDMGAAAIVATPIKKKTGLKVGIIIAAAVVVLVAAAAIFFFTNKATALSLIMGKPNYATMVEGNSIKAVTENLDLPSVSNGIKSASSVVSAIASVNNDYDLLDDLGMSNVTSSPMFAEPMMSSITSADGPTMLISSEDGTVDMASVIASYYELMMNTYGTNSVSATLGVKVDLSDSVKQMLGSDADEILSLLNGTTFSTSVSAAEDKLAAYMNAENGSSVINARTIFTKDGEVYLVMPFISGTGLKVKLPTTETAVSRDEIKLLELDEKEIERMIGELVEIYLAEYKASAIEMENGELSAAGLTATGKLITAEFKGEDLSDLFYKLAKHFADDEYFTAKLVDFINECGDNVTKEEYRQAVVEAFEFDADNDDKLIISTVIDNAGNILAKSYKVADTGSNAKITYVINKNEQFTLEVSEDGATVISLVNDITSPTEGSVTVKCTDGGDGSFTVKLTYSGLGTAEFCGKETLVGKYTLGIELPADFTEEVPEELGKLTNIKFTFANYVDVANTMESTFGMEFGNLGSITLDSSVTAENSDAGLALPTDVIDLGDMEQQPDEATMKKLEEYIKTAGEKLSAMDGAFGDLIRESGLVDGIDMLGGELGGVSSAELNSLYMDIENTLDEISMYASTYNVNDATLNSRVNSLAGNLTKLLNEFMSESTIDADEFQTYKNRYNALRSQADALKADFAAKAQSSAPVVPTTPSTPSGGSGVNTDSMSIDEIVDVLDEYDDRFITLLSNDEIWDRIFDDPAIEALYDACEDAYDDVVDYYDKYLTNYVNGSINAQVFRNLKKATKEYADAVVALENALRMQA